MPPSADRPLTWHPGGSDRRRALAGALVWLLLLAAGALGIARWQRASAADPAQLGPRGLLEVLGAHGRQAPTEVELEFVTPRRTRVGDPVFLAAAPGGFEQVGLIVAVSDAAGPVIGAAARAGVLAVGGRALLYPSAGPLGPAAHIVHYTSDDSLAWVARTLLPPHKRARIRDEIRAALDLHGEAIKAGMLPVVRDAVTAALRAVERELPAVIAAHRPELLTLGADYQDELIRGELLPVVQARIAPIAEREAAPLLRTIGREIWERVSLWRIGSLWLWDSLPLTDGDELEIEWNRLVREEALPILEAHAEEIVAMLRRVAAAAAADPEVRAALRRSVGVLADDERLHALVWSMFRQAVLDNEALKTTLREHWDTPRARAAVADATARLEPVLARIGDTVLGTRAEGIAPEFAQVLRNRVLLKDRQWLVLEPGSSGAGVARRPLMVHPGDSPPPVDRDPFAPEDGR